MATFGRTFGRTFRPLTSAVTEGVGGWSSIVNVGLLDTTAYSTLMQRGRDGLKTNVLVLGDSIAFGYGSNATNNLMRPNGLGPRIASILSAAGIKARAQGQFGNGKLHGTGEARTYDVRVGASAALPSGVTSLGGASYIFTSGASPTVTFTPSENVDTFEVYIYRFGGGGLVSYSIDGGAPVNMNHNGTAGLFTITVSGLSLASHTISFAYVSGAGGYILGFNGYSSADQGLQFINAGINGGKADDFTPNTNAYDSRRVGVALAPSATMLVIGANHWNTAASVSTFTTDLQTLITAYAALGPVMLVSDPASNPASNASLDAQRPYVAAMRQLAATNNCLMFDLWSYFGGAGSNFGANWLADGIHPSPTGYGVAADLIGNALASA